jgi:hypothetical protein
MGVDPSFIKKRLDLQVDSAKPRPPYTGAKYRVGRALRPPRSRSRGAGARFAFEPIRHPQSEPPEMGFDALDSGSGSGAVADDDSVSRGFSLISTSEEAEFVAPPAILGPGVRLVSECRWDQTNLMRLSSKSRHMGMMPSRLSDQTTNTRSSRYSFKT